MPNRNGEQRTAGEVHLERLTESFEISARRWELVVYPSLLAFIVLASYGFFLIYSLTNSVHQMRNDIHHYLSYMSSEMNVMTQSVEVMAQNMTEMTNDVAHVSKSTAIMEPMLHSLNGMKGSLYDVTLAVTYMRNDVGHMTSSFTRSMDMVETMMPIIR